MFIILEVRDTILGKRNETVSEYLTSVFLNSVELEAPEGSLHGNSDQ